MIILHMDPLYFTDVILKMVRLMLGFVFLNIQQTD